MKFKANFVEKPGNFQMDDCQIEKVVELSHEDFCRLKVTPLADQPFLAENQGCMFHRDGVIHCLLALGQGSSDGVLIDAEQYSYPRLAAYIPGMRDIVNAEMDRAADLIIRQGVEKTSTGGWCVYFEEMEERLGLAVRAGNGLDSMLRAALKRRPEVAVVDMHDGGIEMEYRPEYCRRLKGDDPSELRLKDLLPLLKGGGLMFLRHEEADTSVLAENLRQLTAAGQADHAALLNARVLEICETPEGTEVVLTDVAPEELTRFNEAYDAFMEAEQAIEPARKYGCAPLSSYRTMSLIATYEELYHIPEPDRVTCYYGDYGGHFLKHGMTEDAALAAYDKALTAIQMSSDAFQQADGFTYRGGIIARMWSCMLSEDACLADALSCWAEDRDTILLHEDAPDCCVLLENIAKLTDTGRKDFADLLHAKVQEIRVGETSVEVVVSGVEPEELIRFCEAYDAFMEAEWAMGDMTP